MLFTVSSAISDANLRRFTLNSTSAGSNLVTVDGSNGNVYLAIDQRLDYENEQMRPLIIVIEATSLTDRFGAGNVVLRWVGDNDKALKEFEKVTPLSAQIVEIIDRIIAKL